MNQSQELINIIRRIVRQEIQNNAFILVRNGYINDASSYDISAYLDGDESNYIDTIEGMAGFYHGAGDYVTVHTNESGTSWIARLRTNALFPSIAIDVNRGRILLGSGTTVPSNAGSYGQQLYSGGSSGSAYWK